MKIILVLSLLLVILCISSFSHAQTCADTKTAPFSCPTCKTCTGPSSTCCDVVKDAASGAFMDLVKLRKASQDCIDQAKEFTCARCDPKNQGLPTDINGIVLCKSKCLTMQKVCSGVLTFRCDDAPESNCWSSAESIRLVDLKFVVALVISIYLFICHLI
ncbi:predicted protein [Naegleria gruberi]|uniref:Predicted protein n=1 Tax=Naegleria gruberi TaxID=5762 RepID=D2UX38_NAEGR|nr:uncharacterized protein NAEGRDRAFT_61624 [Naegleria gruberi]EFC50557.1 predicted protein [Naegleria gruberi]|eukprot:XP_002683301.1 predicted protein [Naegleria gruberi strain NEG-M]